MNSKIILEISLSAVFAIGMLSMPLGIADAMGSFLDVKKTTVLTDSSEVEKAIFNTKAKIPTDGSGGAFGYGYITTDPERAEDGETVVAVTTTHGGVPDSEAQENAADPVWHNHYVALVQLDEDDKCPGLEVKDITFEEPGDVDVKNKIASMEDVPYYFAGTHSLSMDPITFDTEGDIIAAVSFTIDPVDSNGDTIVDLGDLAAVCINDVAAVDSSDLKVRQVWKIL